MPDASQRPEGAVRSTEFRVRYAETDQMGVVYYANYLVWCEIGRTEFLRTLGRSYADLERAGIFLAVADASLRYHASARYDDLIRVDTTLSSVRSRALEFDYLVLNAESGARLVSARTTLVSLDREGRPSPLPADLRALLAPPA
jgi:acyl-CoA thioester hydrolase